MRDSTRTPLAAAIATVSSVLPQSTTMISSAHDALSMAAPIWAASFLVMMVTVTRGTEESYRAPGSRRPAGFGGPAGLTCSRTGDLQGGLKTALYVSVRRV